ncbi:MAG: hypothetical protein LBI19_09260, partial [Oscillospiraceae bacterium]|nr:hypothetical protein [Oscillospiraceae bacterium]
NGEHIKYTPITNERYRTGDPSVEGMWGVGTSNPSYTFAWSKFRLVSGLFTIISDGKNWGLPNVTNVVESDSVNNVWCGTHTQWEPADSHTPGTPRPTVNSGGLAEGRAVIQRPYEFDRRGDTVIAWDTYILSAADTAAMEIGLHDIGRQINITFEHPERERLTHWVPGSEAVLDGDVYRPGQYHRLDVETVFGFDWIGEKTLYHGLSGISATAIDGALPQNAQVFLNYSNAGTLNRKIRTGVNDWDALQNYMNADVIVITGVDPRNPSRGEVVRWVYIEDYRIGQVSELPGDGTSWNWMFNSSIGVGGWTGPAGTPTINNGQQAADKGPEGTYTPARWDFVAVGQLTIPAQWRTDGSYGPGWSAVRYWFKPINDQEEGLVTSVQGSADVNPGSGFMTMGGVTYNMLQRNNWIRAFQTADVTNKRTITLWHGLVVNIDTTPIKRTYAVVTAAGVDGKTSYNSNTWKNMVDLFLEDGTHAVGYEIDKIFVRNAADTAWVEATARPNNQSVGANQYGTDGNTANGAPLYLQSGSVWEVYGSGESGGKKLLKDNIFEYRFSGNRVTLYEIQAEQKSGPTGDIGFVPPAGRLEATQGGRFNSTWGGTLGNTFGLNNSRGLMMLNNDDHKSAVFVKTKNSKGEDVYNVYNQSVPGFSGVTGITTQTYRMDLNGGINATGGAFVRTAFINAGGALSSTTRTRWAVALDWWVQNDNSSLYAGTVKAMLSDGTEATLTCRDERSTDGTAFKTDPIRRGDVFIYESEDGTPNTISQVTILDSDALVSRYVYSGNVSTFAILGYENGPGSTHVELEGNDAVFYGTQGNNHYYVNARGSEQAARASAAAVADWGISNNGQWNLYIFEAGDRGNYTTMDQILVVRRNDSGNGRNVDNRNFLGKVASLKTKLTDVEIDNKVYATQEAFKEAAMVAINNIFAEFGPAVYLMNPLPSIASIHGDAIAGGNFDGRELTAAISSLNYRVAGMPVADKPGSPKILLPALDIDQTTVVVGLSTAKANVDTHLGVDPIAKLLTKAQTGITAYNTNSFGNNTTTALRAALITYLESLAFFGAFDGAGGAMNVAVTGTPNNARPWTANVSITFSADASAGFTADPWTFSVTVPATAGWAVASATQVSAVVTAGEATIPTITITEMDAWGEVNTGGSTTFTPTLTAEDTAAFAIGGGATASAVSGVATFTGRGLETIVAGEMFVTLHFDGGTYDTVDVVVGFIKELSGQTWNNGGNANYGGWELTANEALDAKAANYFVVDWDLSAIDGGIQFIVDNTWQDSIRVTSKAGLGAKTAVDMSSYNLSALAVGDGIGFATWNPNAAGLGMTNGYVSWFVPATATLFNPPPA